MLSNIIQCDVSGCPERCSETAYGSACSLDRHGVEHAPIPDRPPQRGEGWIFISGSNFSTNGLWLCPQHGLILHALLAGRLFVLQPMSVGMKE